MQVRKQERLTVPVGYDEDMLPPKFKRAYDINLICLFKELLRLPFSNNDIQQPSGLLQAPHDLFPVQVSTCLPDLDNVSITLENSSHEFILLSRHYQCMFSGSHGTDEIISSVDKNKSSDVT